LKDQLEKREYDNGDQVSRLKRLSSDYEYEVLRLKEEKDKLKNELIYLENDHRKDIQNLKTKL
jgi:predicted RNase H-like nuclease (RuvC/YqgF family)